MVLYVSYMGSMVFSGAPWIWNLIAVAAADVLLIVSPGQQATILFKCILEEENCPHSSSVWYLLLISIACHVIFFQSHSADLTSFYSDDVGHDLHIFSIRIDKARL